MNTKLSESYSLARTVSLLERRGKSEGYSEKWRVACASVLLFAVFLNTPRSGWADESYFQIINGDMIPRIDQTFVQDIGYAVYVSYDGKKFLMDTGIKEKNLVRNLKAAGIFLHNLDFVFLSHKHSDHISGALHIRRERPSLPIYIPPGGGFVAPEFIVVNDHLDISPNIIVMHNHDDAGSNRVKDELSLVLKTKKGPYLFTSNSHTDFFAKLAKAKRLAGQDVYFHSGHTAMRSSSVKEITTNAKKWRR